MHHASLVRIVTLLCHQLFVQESVKRPDFLEELLVVRVVNVGEDSLVEAFAFVFIDSILQDMPFLFGQLSVRVRCLFGVLAASGPRYRRYAAVEFGLRFSNGPLLSASLFA